MSGGILSILLVEVAIAALILNRNRRVWTRSRRNRQPGRSRGGVVRRAGGTLRAELSIGWSAGSDLYHRMKNARESLTMAVLERPSSRKRRMSSSLPSSRETPNEPFGRPSFRPKDLAVARPSRVRSEIMSSSTSANNAKRVVMTLV